MLVAAIRNGSPTAIEVPDDLTIGYPIEVQSGGIVISQWFGVISVTGSIHQGLDIVCGNIPAKAVADGVVASTYPYGRDVPGLQSDGSPGGYGNTVLTRHESPGGWPFWSYECHLLAGSIRVEAGDVVRKGDVLGITDSTGVSSGNHMHFELRSDTVYPTRFNPWPFFNRIVAPPPPPPPEDIFNMLTPEGKAFAESVFNSPARRENLAYALALCEALEAAKPGATAALVGSSIVTLGPDGRKAVELDGRALAEIHLAKEVDPVTHEEEWVAPVIDSLVLQRVREQRQWLKAQGFTGDAAGAEPPAPGNPPQP